MPEFYCSSLVLKTRVVEWGGKLFFKNVTYLKLCIFLMLCHEQNHEKNMLDLSKSSKWSAKKHCVWTAPFRSKPEWFFFSFCKTQKDFFFKNDQNVVAFPLSCISFVLILIVHIQTMHISRTHKDQTSHVWICSLTNDILREWWWIPVCSSHKAIEWLLKYWQELCRLLFKCWNLTAPEHSSKKVSHTGLEQNEGD